jgi:hypothetical protein
MEDTVVWVVCIVLALVIMVEAGQNASLYDEKGEIVGAVNAFAVIYGSMVAALCSMNIVTSIVCAVLCVVMLTLSIVCTSGTMWLIIRNEVMWTINIVTSLWYFF